MPTISAQNPLYGGSLYENLLNFKNTAQAVLSLDRNWGTWNHMMIDALSGGTSLPTSDPNGLYRTVIRPRQERTAQILGRTVSGNQLILTFTQNTVDYFRVKDNIVDGLTNALGKVTAYGLGTVTIEPEIGQAAFVSTDFAASNWVSAGWLQSGLQYSTGTTNLYTQKTEQDDYVARQRDTYTLTDMEKVERYFGADGTVWYSYQQKETEMISRFMKSKASKWYNSKVGLGISTPEGITSSTRGVRQGVMQDGLYMPLTASVTQSQIEDAINNIAEVGTDYNIEPAIMLGNKMKSFLNANMYTGFIQYAGQRNTLGGSEVIGNNIQQMNVGNIPVSFVMNDMFNDPVMNPQPTNINGYSGTRGQYTMLVGSYAPIPTIGGGSRPVIQKIHFEGADGRGYRTDLYQPINGMNLNGQTASSPVPGTTWELMTVQGYSSRLDTFVLIEPTV